MYFKREKEEVASMRMGKLHSGPKLIWKVKGCPVDNCDQLTSSATALLSLL